ncbi:MAG: dTMP kinase [Acidimicrobiales bacterium]
MTGKFIAFEGGEACGKSTQARLLAEELDAVLTFEPGATAVGTAIRSLLLNPSTTALADRTEALLMAADRAQHVFEMVRPALAAGRHVVTDRYLYSSVAYQGHGRGLPPDEVAHLSLWATDGLLPDLIVLLDVDVAEAMRRRQRAPDRFEKENDGFHQRVREGYLALASADPQRWAIVEGSGSVRELAVTARSIVRDRLGL